MQGLNNFDIMIIKEKRSKLTLPG